MSGIANRIVQKRWFCCNVLRDDGRSSDYLDQNSLFHFLQKDPVHLQWAS